MCRAQWLNLREETAGAVQLALLYTKEYLSRGVEEHGRRRARLGHGRGLARHGTGTAPAVGEGTVLHDTALVQLGQSVRARLEGHDQTAVEGTMLSE